MDEISTATTNAPFAHVKVFSCAEVLAHHNEHLRNKSAFLNDGTTPTDQEQLDKWEFAAKVFCVYEERSQEGRTTASTGSVFFSHTRNPRVGPAFWVIAAIGDQVRCMDLYDEAPPVYAGDRECNTKEYIDQVAAAARRGRNFYGSGHAGFCFARSESMQGIEAEWDIVLDQLGFFERSIALNEAAARISSASV